MPSNFQSRRNSRPAYDGQIRVKRNSWKVAYDENWLLRWVHPVPFSGCWLWNGSIDGRGYGVVTYKNRTMNAHRASWIIANGSIPAGLELDHLCRVPCCVNPSHLEPVTHLENVRRGIAGKALADWQRAKVQCPRGHLYEDDNLYIDPKGGRRCRACKRALDLRLRAERLSATRPIGAIDGSTN